METDHLLSTSTPIGSTSLYSWKNIPVVLTVGCTLLVSSSLASIVAPFFPIHASKYLNASNFEVSLVFTLFQLAVVIFSPIASKLGTKFGRFGLMISSQILVGISSIIFAYSTSMVWCLILRIFQGVAVASISVSSMGMMVEEFPDNVADAAGIIESIVGFGYAFGPVLGTVLYSYGGYLFTFLFVGAMPLALLVPMIWIARRHASHSNLDSPKVAEDPSCDKEVSFSNILDSRMAICLFAAALATSSFGFVDPLLQIHLDAVLGLTQSEIGICFAGVAAIYSIVCPFMGVFMRYIGNNVRTLQISFGILILSLFLIGPSPALSIFANGTLYAWITQVIGLTLFGMGTAMSYVPCLPILEESVEGNASNHIAGLYISATYLGEAMGPMLASAYMYVLPTTREINCNPKVAHNRCISSFAWATTAYAVTTLICLIFISLGLKNKPNK